MKTLRYRIRLITLALVASLLAVLLLTVRTVWFPDSPPDPSAEPPATVATETPQSDVSPAPTVDASPSPEPLYDTSGL